MIIITIIIFIFIIKTYNCTSAERKCVDVIAIGAALAVVIVIAIVIVSIVVVVSLILIRSKYCNNYDK